MLGRHILFLRLHETKLPFVTVSLRIQLHPFPSFLFELSLSGQNSVRRRRRRPSATRRSCSGSPRRHYWRKSASSAWWRRRYSSTDCPGGARRRVAVPHLLVPHTYCTNSQNPNDCRYVSGEMEMCRERARGKAVQHSLLSIEERVN
nr:hypothetical protein Itr_chr06CG08890 [Ipomoea trifida]